MSGFASLRPPRCAAIPSLYTPLPALRSLRGHSMVLSSLRYVSTMLSPLQSLPCAPPRGAPQRKCHCRGAGRDSPSLFASLRACGYLCHHLLLSCRYVRALGIRIFGTASLMISIARFARLIRSALRAPYYGALRALRKV